MLNATSLIVLGIARTATQDLRELCEYSSNI